MVNEMPTDTSNFDQEIEVPQAKDRETANNENCDAKKDKGSCFFIFCCKETKKRNNEKGNTCQKTVHPSAGWAISMVENSKAK
jgi:hypothetical protein